MCTDEGVENDAVDLFITGYSGEKTVQCFAVQAESEDQVHDMLASLLCGGSYEVDFVIEKDWKAYRDFAGPKGRFPMTEKYLDDPIDTVEQILKRSEV